MITKLLLDYIARNDVYVDWNLVEVIFSRLVGTSSYELQTSRFVFFGLLLNPKLSECEDIHFSISD